METPLIRIEIEDETSLLHERAPGIVPFLMEESVKDGRPLLAAEIYRGAEDAARQFLSEFEGKWFTDPALRALDGLLAPYFASVGYARERQGLLRYYHSYRLDPADAVSETLREKILPRTLLLQDDPSLADLPAEISLSPALLLERWRHRPDLPCAVTVEGDRIVAVAAVGDANPDSRIREITVETSPTARRQGFGRSSVACLSAELQRLGLSCAYCCSRWNRPSRRIAEALGYRHTGRFYAVSGYRN